MHWKYEWVEQLPQSVYAVLVQMLNKEATQTSEDSEPDAVADELEA